MSRLFPSLQACAQEEERKDAEGCKDSPLITRFPGSIINSCDNKEYDQADLPWKDGGTKHVEGEYHYWDIATRPGISEIQVFRNFQTAIKNAGFTIDLHDVARSNRGAQRLDLDLHRRSRRLLLSDNRHREGDEAGSDG